MILPSRRLRVSSLVAFLVLLSVFFWAQDSWGDQVEAEETERWFEIEVILYKANSETGLTNESWSADTQLELPIGIIDFLQPFSQAEQSTDVEIDQNSQDLQIRAKHQKTQTSSDQNIDDSGVFESKQVGFVIVADDKHQPPLALPLDQEKPFIPLQQNNFRLTTEANRLSDNYNYTLINHFAWRQPVFGKRQSLPIRIAGGFDYHEAFDYAGSQKNDPAPLIELENENVESSFSQNSEHTDSFIEAPTIEDTITEKTRNLPITVQNENKISPVKNEKNEPFPNTETGSIFDPVPLPWVPEIDGSMRVYIQRNYLHIDTNLFYRLPQKEEVSALDLTDTVISFENGLSGFSNAIEGKILTQSDSPINNFSPTEETLSKSTDFDWQLDSDFLAKKAEKFFITRLFNYPLNQTRRLRSGELHYFDHPLIGMLVMIRPYERDLQPSESNGIELINLGVSSSADEKGDATLSNQDPSNSSKKDNADN